MERIRIAVANGGAGAVPMFAIVEGGYFREQRLDLDLISFQGHNWSPPAVIGAIAEPVAPEETIDLSLVTRQERENYFATMLRVPGRSVGGKL